MANAKDPVRVTALDVMEDGTWHKYAEFMSACRSLIAPEIAARRWLHEEKYRIRRKKDHEEGQDISEELARTPFDDRVAFGQRRHVSNVLSRMVGEGQVERKKIDAVNYYRLTPPALVE